MALRLTREQLIAERLPPTEDRCVVHAWTRSGRRLPSAI